MIFFYQIKESEDELPQAEYWRAWTNCDKRDKVDLLLSMAVNKHMRERGGIDADKDFQPIWVYWYWDGEPTINNTLQPKRCNLVTYNIHDEELKDWRPLTAEQSEQNAHKESLNHGWH